MKQLDFPKVTASKRKDKSVYPGPGSELGPLSPLHPTPLHPGFKNAPSMLVFIWPPRLHQKPGICEEPDTPFSGDQACSRHPYGKGKSWSAALPSANLWVAREEG